MREIKFRAWCKEHGMSESCSIWDLQIMDAEGLTNMDEVKIMQSTGIKDKNGVEIFEGDIVKARLYVQGEDWEWETGVYKWDDENAGFKWYDKNGLPWNVMCTQLEVVGNIYEESEA